MTTSPISVHTPGLLLASLVTLVVFGGAPRVAAASEAPAKGSAESVKGKPVPGAAIDPEATSFPYPFPVRFFPVTVERQEVRIAFMDVSPTQRPNGRTVVLLHGKNFSGAYWEPTIRVLTAEGFRVVVPDQIGFGKSTKPAAFQFSFQVLADTTRALMDSLHIERFAVVGHSMGGMLATRFALMFPERTEKLVLVNRPLSLDRSGVRRGAARNPGDDSQLPAHQLLRGALGAGVREADRASSGVDASPGLSARRLVFRAYLGHGLHPARRLRVSAGPHADAADHRAARPHRHRPRLGAQGRRRDAGRLPRIGPQSGGGDTRRQAG